MSLPEISVINFSPKLKDFDVQEAIRAVNRQIAEDFMSIWGMGRSLVLHAATVDPADPSSLIAEPVRGSAVVYLLDESTLPGALGYHDLNARDLPVAFVFVLDANDWTTTLSHEVLELMLDPTVNILVPGPDPRDSSNIVLHAYEACDAVERASYTIDGIAVSDFLTPSYFTEGEGPGTRNDFLGVGVDSFGVTKDSHIAFFDLNVGSWTTFFGTHAAAGRISAARAKMYAHPKPGRPSDETLLEDLRKYRRSLPTARKGEGAKGLTQLRGITRASRYRQLGDALARKLGRGGKGKAQAAGRGGPRDKGR